MSSGGNMCPAATYGNGNLASPGIFALLRTGAHHEDAVIVGR